MLTLRLVLFWFAGLAIALGAEPDVLESRYSEANFELTANPAAPQWGDVRGVFLSRNYLGEPLPGPPTEIRSRWTGKNLYLLYICPYDGLNLKPNPNVIAETPRLWEWDVGEAFIGSDLEHIEKYKELQVSPQGEWVDLDINRGDSKAQLGTSWNSGYKVRARIDKEKRIWYGEMAIPLSALGVDQPHAGLEMRIGLYRIAGVGADRKYYAWRPTGQTSFHVPAAFGRLRLVK